jgi:hypothetical protein
MSIQKPSARSWRHTHNQRSDRDAIRWSAAWLHAAPVRVVAEPNASLHAEKVVAAGLNGADVIVQTRISTVGYGIVADVQIGCAVLDPSPAMGNEVAID